MTPTSEDASTRDSSPQPASSKKASSVVLQDQSSRLPLRKILIIYFGIGMALIVSFMDQSSVTTAAPQMGTSLGGSASISWVGTAYFASNCALQLLYGRLSDIFGRKYMLQSAVLLMLIGDLLCSFAQTPIQLYAFRAIAGIGGGGINNIAMVIVSDIIPLKERGKYQGLVAAATSVGNAIGPFVGGGLAAAGQWRWVFRVTAMLSAVVIGLDHFILPLKPVVGSAREKLKQVDYLGIAMSAAGTLLLLVAISGGGSAFPWNGAVTISLLVSGGVLGLVFLVVEWRAKLPILPLYIFKERTAAVVMAQSFFLGMTYFGNMYQVPQYLQYVKGYSSLVSGAIVLAYIMPQAMWGILSGFYISNTNHYKRVIILGGMLWTTELGLQVLWGQKTSIGMIIGILQINGIGIGFSLQTTLVAALATTANKDRAVVTAGRNFFRTMGGAFGLAIANSIYQSEVVKSLQAISSLTDDQRSALVSASLANLSAYSENTVVEIRNAYSSGLQMVFVAFAALGAVYVILSFGVQEVVFRKDPPNLEEEKRKARAGGSDGEQAMQLEHVGATGSEVVGEEPTTVGVDNESSEVVEKSMV